MEAQTHTHSPGWTSFDYAGVGAGGEGTAVKTDASAVMASWSNSGTKQPELNIEQ
jgi:hypothetical protein